MDTYNPPSRKKKWKCAFCCADYNAHVGLPHRILVFADPRKEDTKVKIARVGDITDRQASAIRLFQIARLLEDRKNREERR